MRVKDHANADAKMVWLDREDVDIFVDHIEDTRRRIAMELMVRGGLRRAETLGVTVQDLVKGNQLHRVRIREGKGGKYREPPIPESLYAAAHAYADASGTEPNEPIVDASVRTIDRWLTRIREACADSTGDEMWNELTAHDLRRSWAHICLEVEVEPGMLMEWGGWENWSTFRENYLGPYSTRMEREQADKVPWL